MHPHVDSPSGWWTALFAAAALSASGGCFDPVDGRVSGGVQDACVTLSLVTPEAPVAPGTTVYVGLELSDEAELPVRWQLTPVVGSSATLQRALGGASFGTDLLGDYVVRADADGACEPAEAVVEVDTADALRVELFWAPLEPERAETFLGRDLDLDLHLLHPDCEGVDVDDDGRPDGWFDAFFDLYWYNERGEWGGHTPASYATFGLTNNPEAAMIPQVVTHGSYRIGVHLFDDRGAGPAKATVRIHVTGQPTIEVSEVLWRHDLWEVARVVWPNGPVVQEMHRVTPDVRVSE